MQFNPWEFQFNPSSGRSARLTFTRRRCTRPMVYPLRRPSAPLWKEFPMTRSIHPFRPNTWLALAGLSFLLACSGGSSYTGATGEDPNQVVATSTAMTSEEANTVTAAVLDSFQVKGSATDLAQALVRSGDEGVYAVDPAINPCVTVVPQNNGGTITTTYTFSNCTNAAGGGSVNGTVVTVNTIGSNSYSISYQNLTVTRGTESFTVNGTQTATLDRVARTSTIAMPSPGMSIVYAKSGSSGTYSLVGSLNGDYATAQTFKLFGSCVLTKAGGKAETVTIESADPVTWRESTGCCYPVAGTIKLYETLSLSAAGQSYTGTKQVAAYTFTSTCGTVSYTAYTYQLTRSGGVNQIPVGPTSLVLPACP